MNDPRVDLIRQVQKQHMIRFAAVKRTKKPEEWQCQCGTGFRGDGALEKGRRHEATEILDALDGAAAVA